MAVRLATADHQGGREGREKEREREERSTATGAGRIGREKQRKTGLMPEY